MRTALVSAAAQRSSFDALWDLGGAVGCAKRATHEWVSLGFGPKHSRGTYPGIVCFLRKPSKTQTKNWFLKRTMVEKNGESIRRNMGTLKEQHDCFLGSA